MRKALMAVLVAALFMITLLPAPQANPLVPYCAGGIAGGSSATSDQVSPEVCQLTTGRVFPEGIEDTDYIPGQERNGFTGSAPAIAATDYVGFYEFQAGLDYLAGQFPEYIEVHEVAMSRGNPNLIGEDTNPIYMLEISNEDSPIPRNEKLNILFMLSIHGNEKGGREGGFRVLEDLLRNIGFATETVQNGAGLIEPIQKPTGGQVETYRDYLDFMNVFLLFPNSDGWACDELEYAGSACPGLFTRGNGNGIDLNRQTPTIGWARVGSSSHQAVKEPEAVGYLNWMVEQRSQNDSFEWNYAIDIHGMLNHQNFGAIMLPAGSFSPQEMYRSLRLAETLKERWNADPHFAEWGTMFATAEEAWAAAGTLCGTVDCPAGLGEGNPPSQAVSSPQFAEYYTVIDAIGYTDSGFSGDFFAQSTGLNAPGYDIELAYNHITCSAQYECGAMFNDYHIWMVRHIVKSFMDAAALDVKISYETSGRTTAYIPSEYVATNADDESLTPGGWAEANPNDDAWDYDENQTFQARPAKYWEDIVPFVKNGDVPGTLDARNADELTASTLQNYDNLVIAGSALNQLVAGAWGENQVADGEPDEARINAIMNWVNDGGNLVLTDAALELLDIAGVTDDAVSVSATYMGGIRMDLTNPLLDKVRGGVKQTYEPTPLGWGTTQSAPNWHVDETAYLSAGGVIAGRFCGGPNLNQNCDNNPVALGEIPYGDGTIRIMGAILPDPTEEYYHPYGLDDYATTYSGNQVIRNLLGWTETVEAPPVTFGSDGSIIQSPNEPTAISNGEGEEGQDGGGVKKSPGVGIVALLGLLALALRRKA